MRPRRVALHPSSATGTAAAYQKKRQKRKSARIRTCSAANAAIDAGVGEQLAKRARDAPQSDEPPDDTEMN